MTEIINSVPAGLSQFLNWKVWVAVVVYIIAVVAFTVMSGALMGGENASGKRVGLGCLFYMFGGALWQGVLMALFVALFFLPLLGVDQLLPPDVLVSTLPQVLWAGAIAAVAITHRRTTGRQFTRYPGIPNGCHHLPCLRRR